MDTDHQLQYRLGFQECLSETARFLVDLDGAGDDMCLRLVAHLQKHFDKISGAGEEQLGGLGARGSAPSLRCWLACGKITAGRNSGP